MGSGCRRRSDDKIKKQQTHGATVLGLSDSEKFALVKFTASTISEHVMERKDQVMIMTNIPCGLSEKDASTAGLVRQKKSIERSPHSSCVGMRKDINGKSTAKYYKYILIALQLWQDIAFSKVKDSHLKREFELWCLGAHVKGPENARRRNAAQDFRRQKRHKDDFFGLDKIVSHVWTENTWVDAHLKNSLHVEGLAKSLISLSAVSLRGVAVQDKP
ncbi:uncharacterized protein PHALS_07363 [Plasmopara halstedii]|uniref:Uncharacterized protein n=1 Tax=Plasmopara halstedii TaxID=4781 RepID=A0A0P1B6S0_PLAHL|nr:uncharacterized protein PHALS_07363 [Plasmopara halstedii]CEG49607.1 hypothetical protein PHALS_07363 [Plasmopara halstedii]|eukprot:XP_024585976.1 hypothetical protein PHALS_07363 [Plasmopara halstedii]